LVGLNQPVPPVKHKPSAAKGENPPAQERLGPNEAIRAKILSGKRRD
jgi:hypothetical protein